LHAHGIVHRDLKPTNIMLARNDVASAQILDLGIARFAAASTDLTAQGSHLGTPRYMAPEQIRDPRTVDGRADVFALGCVLFECLTGVPAFPGDDPVAVLAQILFGEATEPSELRRELPEPIDRLLLSLLARRPELRPSVDEALRSEFRRWLVPPSRGLLAALPPIAAMPPRAAQLMTVEAAETDWEGAGKPNAAPGLLDRASQPVPFFLVENLPRLIGRERELGELRTWLTASGPITLWGSAGVGKTRLARALIGQLIEDGSFSSHAVVLCDLSEARDSRDVARLVGAAVGLAPPRGDQVEDQLGRMLAKLSSLLLVLDRVEHLAREIEPLVQHWARAAPALRLLVTSRVRLRSTRAYELGPLVNRSRSRHGSLPPSAASVPPDPSLPPTAAAALVLSLARGSSATEVSAELTVQAEQIGARLEGNPLAIELAMARLPLLGFSGILERLPALASAPRPRESGAEPSERPLSAAMRGAIEWSWQLLNDPERQAFVQCGVFHGPFSLDAAERILRLPSDRSSVLEVIESLREQSLLVSLASDRAGDVRLSMPSVLREFAREQLERVGEACDAVRVRHAAYCVEYPGLLDSDDAIAALACTLSAETRDVSHALTLLASLEPTLLAAGPSSRLASQLEAALTSFDAMVEPNDRLVLQAARVRQLRARLLAPAGELARADRDLEAVRADAERLNDRQLLGTTLLDLGVVHHFRREFAAARARYEAALDVLADVDDAVAEARCHGNLGAVFHDQAELAEAARGYRSAIALLPPHGQERLL
ncbi:MAG TPA: protein kinase, partial [Polyangiales bacterium]|nr:protein kinase [Polyangiales bacterium]